MSIGSANFYYVRYSVLLRCLWLTFKSFNIRLWLLTLFFLILYIINLSLHVFFRLIDEVFYRNFKKVKIKEPVFIIANPRSGTTLLHRLMAIDTYRFSHIKFAYTLFCSVSFIRFYLALKRIDASIGNPLKTSIHFIESLLFKGWKGVHNMSFGQAEEDEALFAQMMMSPGIFILFPFLDKIKDTHCLDNEDEEVRKNAMAFYEDCLKRFMYATGNNRIYLAKNVNSTGRIRTILEKFPDARLIFIVRNPMETVPSTASMFSAMYPLHSPHLKETNVAYREWCELSIAYYKHFAEVKKQFDKNRIISLKYDDLINEPAQIVEEIYTQFGWNFSKEFSKKLEAEIVKRSNYKSAHTYSPEKYGYTEDKILERLEKIIETFDFLSVSETAAHA